MCCPDGGTEETSAALSCWPRSARLFSLFSLSLDRCVSLLLVSSRSDSTSFALCTCIHTSSLILSLSLFPAPCSPIPLLPPRPVFRFATSVGGREGGRERRVVLVAPVVRCRQARHPEEGCREGERESQGGTVSMGGSRGVGRGGGGHCSRAPLEGGRKRLTFRGGPKNDRALSL